MRQLTIHGHSQVKHHLETFASPVESCCPEECTHIIDGNAFLQSLMRLPRTFRELALTVIQRLPKGRTVHFVTDSYFDDSIKAEERLRRGSSAKLLIGPLTKLPRDFGAFMHNTDNKKQLIKFLLTEWHWPNYACYLSTRSVYFVCEYECFCLQLEECYSVCAASSRRYSNVATSLPY